MADAAMGMQAKEGEHPCPISVGHSPLGISHTQFISQEFPLEQQKPYA